MSDYLDNNQTPNHYNYSWHQDDFGSSIPPKKKKNGKKALRIVGLCLAVCLCLGVFALAGIGANYLYNGGTNGTVQQGSGEGGNENVPSLSIVSVSDPDKDKEVKEGEPLSNTQIVKKVKPSVVGVVAAISQGGLMGNSSGSGFVISEDGYIATNQHVVENATSVMVFFEDGSEHEATIVGQDRQADIAILKIEATGLTPVEFGDSDLLEVGEPVLAIGNPLGLELFGTTTSGVVSAINRNVTVEDRQMTLLQTDAAINEGNSGGPLINQYGQVIGINNAGIAKNTAEGLGFAIPSNTAVPVMESLMKYGYVKDRPLIGISGKDVSQQISNYYDLPQGVIVYSVTPGSGAEKAGVQEGDIIVKADGEIVRNMTELNLKKDAHKAGDTMVLSIYRNGKTFDVNVVLMENTTGN